MTLAWAPGSHWWQLLRMVMGSVGSIIAVISVLCGGINYQDNRN
ncbi:hypothetical protein [Rhodocytophaga rosea]|nr:hypothetical protein [Rhodocytophaga rosea]